MSIKVLLNENEQRVVKHISRKRYESARKNGFNDLQKSDQNKLDMDEDGYGGEFALCKYFNIYPSFSTGMTDKDDCVMPCGAKVDVKTTRNTNGNLIAMNTKDANDVDLYALVIKISDAEFIIAGFAFSSQLISDQGYKNFQDHPSLNGEGYFLHRKDLHKWIDNREWRN